MPLTQAQLVRLATNDLSDPRNLDEARGWLDGLHEQEFTLRDIIGRVLLAAERAAAPTPTGRPGAVDPGPVDPGEDGREGPGHDDREDLTAEVVAELARAERRPVQVTDSDVTVLTRFLSDRIHNENSTLPQRQVYDLAQELIDAGRSDSARQRAHRVDVATRLLEILRDEPLEPGADHEVLAVLRQRVETELAAAERSDR